MKKIILFFLFTINYTLFTINSFGQGTIRGKITDANGETLIGVTIVLKSNLSVGTITDLDGNYTLKITKDTIQTLKISYLGYYPIEEFVHPVKGEVIIKNFVLTQVSATINEVEIIAKAEKATEYYMESIKQKSATSIDYISSETMKKTGDVNVTAAVARVSGVSTYGGFITVRGIGDRYIKTTINDARIPTLDPFTNNIKLDLFPSSLIDNVIITKTASPDLPGDWAGAYLSIQTKDYPDKLSVNVETSVGYNDQSTFKEVVSSQQSSTDWLGYDNSLRAHDNTVFQNAITSPDQFQDFVALGLGNYYKSLGVNNNTPWNETYFKLGLVQMGLLAPALINDADAIATATSAYNNGPYHAEAFDLLNAGAAKTGQSFPDNWNTTTRKAPIDFSQNFSIGNQINLFGQPFGFLMGFRYGSSTQYDPHSTAERPYPVTGILQTSKLQQASTETNGWSALFNLAYKINPNNSISVLFMPNLTGVNKVINAVDTIQGNLTKAQFYESRKQMVYQFKSEHYIPVIKLKINADASYTDAKSSTPDFKDLLYYGSNSTNSYFTLDFSNEPADRYYRYLEDYLFDSHISAELPIGNKPGLVRKLKFGVAYQSDNQRRDQYKYFVNKWVDATTPQAKDIDELLSLDKFGITNTTKYWYYSEDYSPTNHTFGSSSVKAGFVMLDYTLIPSLRISGGLRVEQTNIFSDVDEFSDNGYAVNDPRRFIASTATTANPGKMDTISYLPSVNIIYKLKNSDVAPINLRFNYSQTVARPSIRELSDASEFDYDLQAQVTGNSNLKIVHIYNYDLRCESYFKNGDNASVSLFYKDFKNHIELEYSDSYYWQNVDKSYAEGIELEGRKAITKQLEFLANVTFVYSRSKFVRTRKEVDKYIKEDTVNRPMFGQAPYIINGILAYTFDKIGIKTALSYNVQGPRLVLASNNKSIPDIYELDRNLLDFKVSKTVDKHFSVSLKIRDILNAPIVRAYKYPQGYTMDYDKYRYGTSFIISILYKL